MQGAFGQPMDHLLRDTFETVLWLLKMPKQVNSILKVFGHSNGEKSI
jgi:hypothetical protein